MRETPAPKTRSQIIELRNHPRVSVTCIPDSIEDTERQQPQPKQRRTLPFKLIQNPHPCVSTIPCSPARRPGVIGCCDCSWEAAPETHSMSIEEIASSNRRRSSCDMTCGKSDREASSSADWHTGRGEQSLRHDSGQPIAESPLF